MEVQSSYLEWVITFFISVSVLWLAKKYKNKSRIHRLPPGPWKLPLIGNLHQLATAGTLPHHALLKLAHKYGPLMHLQLGEISAVIVSSPEITKEIMKTHEVAFLHRPEVQSGKILSYDAADIIFAPYGDYWRQMRKICKLELLSVKRVQSFSFIRQDEVAKFIEWIHSSAGSPINLSTGIFDSISTIISRAAIGNKPKDQEKILSLVKKVVEISDGFDLVDLFPSLKLIHFMSRTKAKLEEEHKKQDMILDTIIKEHQAKKMTLKEGLGEEEPESFVDVLLRIQQGGDLEVPVTDNNLKAVIWDMFAAGSDTPATILEWAMAELMRNPRAREKAQAEIRQAFKGKETIHESDIEELGYLKSVIKETLRLHPPGPLLLPRECGETTIINGYEIPMKTKVIVNAFALGRDPNYWYDADSFIPERFHGTSLDFRGANFEYLPFGGGRRICPGITFGLAAVEFALVKLLYHFNWELPNGLKPEELDMIEDFGAICGRKNDLHVIPTPYDPSIHDNDN